MDPRCPSYMSAISSRNSVILSRLVSYSSLIRALFFQSLGLALLRFCAPPDWEGLSPTSRVSSLSRNGDGETKAIPTGIAGQPMVLLWRWKGACPKLETSSRNYRFGKSLITPLATSIRRLLTVLRWTWRNRSPPTLAVTCTSAWVIGRILTAWAILMLLEIELSILGKDS